MRTLTFIGRYAQGDSHTDLVARNMAGLNPIRCSNADDVRRGILAATRGCGHSEFDTIDIVDHSEGPGIQLLAGSRLLATDAHGDLTGDSAVVTYELCRILSSRGALRLLGCGVAQGVEGDALLSAIGNHLRPTQMVYGALIFVEPDAFTEKGLQLDSDCFALHSLLDVRAGTPKGRLERLEYCQAKPDVAPLKGRARLLGREPGVCPHCGGPKVTR